MSSTEIEVSPQTFQALPGVESVEGRPHPVDPESGLQMLVRLVDGSQVSLVRTRWSYGGDEGLVEAAIIKDGGVDADSVTGWLDIAGATEYVRKAGEAAVTALEARKQVEQ